MPTSHATRMLILGSGAAGLTAAIYAARAGHDPIVVHGLQPGGQMTTTTDVENYPGFEAVIQGPWLMAQMQAQAEKVGTRMMGDQIVALDVSRRPFRALGDGGDTYVADALVVATGAQAKWLGLPSEQDLRGRGVSACATCDGFFYRGRRVAVIGGGDTAAKEALHLAHHSPEVIMIHRRDRFRSEKILQERLFANPRIRVLWNTVVDRFVAGGPGQGLTGLALRDTLTGEASSLEVEGAFVAIGHTPATETFRGLLQLDADGYIVLEPGTTRTNIAGVFACGDVADRRYRQAVTAAGTGCMAALDAVDFLAQADFAAADTRPAVRA